MIGQYYSYIEGPARNRAMSVPTISRARDLMASVISCMNLKMYTEIWNGNEMEKVPLLMRSTGQGAATGSLVWLFSSGAAAQARSDAYAEQWMRDNA